MNNQLANPLRDILNGFAVTKPGYAEYRRRMTLERGQMEIRHLKLRRAGDDAVIGGCGCRGCQAARESTIEMERRTR